MSSKSTPQASGSKKSPLGEVIPIRLSARTEANIGVAREKMGLKDQEVIRLAAEIGLAVLAGLKYDPAALVARFVLENQPEGATYQLRDPQELRVAENAARNDEEETAKALDALHAQDRARRAREEAARKKTSPAARK